jgi:hypothetical protein
MGKILLVVVLAASGCAARTAKAQSRDARAGEAKVAPAPVRPGAIDETQLLEDVRVLSADEMQGRAVGTAGGARARAYVVGRFRQAGLVPLWEGSFEKPFDTSPLDRGKKQRGVNVVGVSRGRKNPERFVVVTAHYDHLGVKGGRVYNGADDNASGVAVLLQLATRCGHERPENSLIFAALDAEEVGLQGARALVKALVAEKRDVALNVNLDMVSRGDAGALYAAGAHHTPALKPLLERVAEHAPVKLLLGHDRSELGKDDWTWQSDHGAFHRQKIPFVYFGVEDHGDYHKPTDDFDAISQGFFLKSADTILDAVGMLDANLEVVLQDEHKSEKQPAAP